jgi:glutamine synthetase
MSVSKNGTNLFYEADGDECISPLAWSFVDRLLNNANDICLILNSSVNAYRRLDPRFEAPNQVKASAVDRTSMIRIPLGNEKTARIEMRAVGPDANPYLAFFALLVTGLEGPLQEAFAPEQRRTASQNLPANIYDAIQQFRNSQFVRQMLGEATMERFVERKLMTANRAPRELGSIVKTSEILFHHEVTNQFLWSRF